MNSKLSIYDHTQASLLLPWLVNETLSDAERSAVERHVGECDECREDVVALQQLQAAIRNDALTPIVPKGDPQNLLDALDPQQGSESQEADYRRRLLPAFAIAASVLVALIVLFQLDREPVEPVIYETATSDASALGMDYIVSVTFAPHTGEPRRQEVLEWMQATDVAHEGGDDYKATIRLSINSMEQLQSYTDHLTSMVGVQSVEVVAVQLPVRGNQ